MLFFENRRLKKEIEKLYTNLAKSQQECRNKQNEIDRLKAVNTLISKDLNELKSMVRDQTKADILINALKAIGAIPTEEKIDFEKRQRDLQNQLGRTHSLDMRAQQYAQQGLADWLSGGSF